MDTRRRREVVHLGDVLTDQPADEFAGEIVELKAQRGRHGRAG